MEVVSSQSPPRRATAGDVLLDWSEWPVLLVRPPNHQISDSQLMEFIDVWDREICARRQPYSIALDLRQAAQMSAAQRKLLTDTMSSSEDQLNMFCQGTALVFSSTLLRGMLTAVFWFFRPKYPTRVFGSTTDANAWCHDRIRDHEADSA
jgi:hypothetical protein